MWAQPAAGSRRIHGARSAIVTVRTQALTCIPGTVAIRVQLISIRHGRAVVTGVRHAISVVILLAWIPRSGAVVLVPRHGGQVPVSGADTVIVLIIEGIARAEVARVTEGVAVPVGPWRIRDRETVVHVVADVVPIIVRRDEGPVRCDRIAALVSTQTSICSPVHTAVCRLSRGGAPPVAMGLQISVWGSYLPPTSTPPQTSITFPVQTAV